MFYSVSVSLWQHPQPYHSNTRFQVSTDGSWKGHIPRWQRTVEGLWHMCTLKRAEIVILIFSVITLKFKMYYFMLFELSATVVHDLKKPKYFPIAQACFTQKAVCTTIINQLWDVVSQWTRYWIELCLVAVLCRRDVGVCKNQSQHLCCDLPCVWMDLVSVKGQELCRWCRLSWIAKPTEIQLSKHNPRNLPQFC